METQVTPTAKKALADIGQPLTESASQKVNLTADQLHQLREKGYQTITTPDGLRILEPLNG